MIGNAPKFAVEAVFLPATPKADDPLGQRGYLAFKALGGMVQPVLDGDVQSAFNALKDEACKQVEAALLAALMTPDTSSRA